MSPDPGRGWHTAPEEVRMKRDLGVWISDDCALVLIDYQPELFESIRSESRGSDRAPCPPAG